MMKLGLDFHGVITDNFKFFANFADMVLRSGGEVHIITGARREMFEKQCKEFFNEPIPHSDFFSISDYHIEKGTPVDLSDPDFPKMDSKIWDGTKANYCREQGIDLMIDDSPHYGEHFTTPYMLYRNELNADLFKWDVVKDIRGRTTK
jgi:hypothetical protein